MTDQPASAPEQQPSRKPTAQPAEQSAPQSSAPQQLEKPRAKPATGLVFADPFAQQTSDDTDAAWGESSSRRTLDWYLDQRPPHHGD
jgi:hypothetical protein